jgi:7,8-dihydro-6-hydroxymethylpterin dimethyltransferase
MARLETRDDTYFTTVRGMCRHCGQITPARVFFRHGAVWQHSLCPDCDSGPAKIADDQDWYMESVLRAHTDHSPIKGARVPSLGCPLDCGPCTWHATPCQLPVFSVTNVCNLDCPICFTYNRNDKPWHMSLEEARVTVDWIIRSSGPVDLLNITGGEPTLHPDLINLLKSCRRPEVGRLTMNTNGLRLAEDYTLCEELAELDVCVILSFNTLDPQASVRIHGRDIVAQKMQAIEHLTRADARMALLTVLIRGLNEDTPGRVLDLMRSNDRVLSLTVQTMTYTGQGGAHFGDRAHIPVDEAVKIVCEHSKGTLVPSDFISRPSAHPLCYAVSYLLKSDDDFIPFARFADPEKLRNVMSDSYLIRPEQGAEFFRELIDRAYASGNANHLAALRDLVERLYPRDRALDSFERQRIAESRVRTVYIHSHMDEDTFDCSRAMMCPDLVPTEPGKWIPACTYNLLYRARDERFYSPRPSGSGPAKTVSFPILEAHDDG